MTDFGGITPVLRSFDERKAREFYVGFLGWDVVFEHRLTEGGPLYMGLTSGQARIHLSEHFGDAAPGATLRIEVDDLMAYLRVLEAKRYAHARPGTEPREPTPWGTVECPISDPFGNRLVFWEEVADAP
ncbi:MAG: glyoxalase superfamily protein [Myxococcota bacterium]